MTSQTLTEQDRAAAAAVPARIIEAWARNDAAAFGEIFTEDGTMILPGVFRQGREEISAFMAEAFTTFLKGTRVTGAPIAIKPLGADTVLLITAGGVLHAGDKEVTAERAIRASWLLARRDGEWLLTAYQNSPANLAG
ncbi:SgcJ/EcaC family oxidoreductase [Catenulispora rubra]|uniref:SgcJ/EcaC family oxidoreductase n=1 Tax=Catenulispora rubra TaxID=280293 RepID=UPI001892137D|nr:SgcJ/EcaC family oxidoreductase [Catenulispora rubra]